MPGGPLRAWCTTSRLGTWEGKERKQKKGNLDPLQAAGVCPLSGCWDLRTVPPHPPPLLREVRDSAWVTEHTHTHTHTGRTGLDSGASTPGWRRSQQPTNRGFQGGWPRPKSREDSAASLDSFTGMWAGFRAPRGLTTALAAIGSWCWEDENTPGWSYTEDVSCLKAEVKWDTLPLVRQEASRPTPSPPSPAGVGAWLPLLGSETQRTTERSQPSVGTHTGSWGPPPTVLAASGSIPVTGRCCFYPVL